MIKEVGQKWLTTKWSQVGNMCYKETILTIALVLVICAVNSTEGDFQKYF